MKTKKSPKNQLNKEIKPVKVIPASRASIIGGKITVLKLDDVNGPSKPPPPPSMGGGLPPPPPPPPPPRKRVSIAPIPAVGGKEPESKKT